MKMVDDKQAKKRPRDILASLDAAFAPTKAKTASKYTAQAAVQANAAVAQQAYQHGKHKKKKAAPANANTASTQVNGGQKAAKPDAQQRNGAQNGAVTQQQTPKEPYDPLYGRLDVEVLQVGLKNCSLHSKATSMRKANTLNAALTQYIGALTSEGNASSATNKLKNKVLQFDNPIRTTDASKRVNQAQAQSAKLLSARQRRKLGMHMMASTIEFSEAEKLCEIWRRYAREVIGSDFVGDRSDQAVRTARLQAKLRNIDLSGCPIEVVKARNPLNVGTVGIIVADKTQVIQVCVPHSSTVLTLPKRELRFRVALDEQRAFFIDGQWLLNRRQANE